ncbi:MAG: hypothetical protein EOO52_18275 [Gammaproteobacteria bacterium]|nr:MAG: hypothetical protein EOO52_18275 [Gammaproteobacteria bacterium]
MKNLIAAVIFSISLISFPVFSGEWLDVNLNQIELTPTNGGNYAEGIWFSSPTPYATSLTCANNRYITIKDTKLADRTLSIALYAKATSAKIRVYVNGCDSQGYLNGIQSMLITSQ